MEPWADWTLYSPRKLLGVADGGILVAESSGGEVPQPMERPDAIALWTAPLLRYEDWTEADNQTWHQANQLVKSRLKADRSEMTRWKKWILSRTSLEPLADRRRRNWRVLRSHLGRWLAWEGNPDAAPFGYLMKVPIGQRPEILRALHSNCIFAAVHYPSLPSPAEQFAVEHELNRQVITLPCDHRYDENTMQSVAQKVLSVIS